MPRFSIAGFRGDAAVELADGTRATTLLRRGERVGAWTLMEVVAAPPGQLPFAVLEDFVHQDGSILLVDARGVRLALPKTSESSVAATPGRFLGHTAEAVKASATDLLGNAILSRSGDPEYGVVEQVFPPLKVVKWDTHNFVGQPETLDKIAFTYGGRTPNFDPALVQPSIEAVRKEGNVRHGLVGGYLPVMRYVYPEAGGAWTEMLAFAPLRFGNGNTRVQPVWYRVSRIENGRLKWSRCFDSYPPFLPDHVDAPAAFYADLVQLKTGWDDMLEPGIRLELPDERLANLARFSLIRAIMTRAAGYPKYGVYDKDYGGTEHDGFPDTFTVETTAMLDWGLVERAGRYIDNYFGAFVRDDGSILYRGPETGQYGRMLTVLAQYGNVGGDTAPLLRHRKRIEAVAALLLGLREKALQRPTTDPAYGMLAGWSEADSALEKDPARYVQPYFSNSTEAARGLRDLGRLWSTIGRQTGDNTLLERGRRWVDEAAALRRDLDAALSRSMLRVGGESILPAIAGVKEPFHVAVQRDNVDPQYRSYRAYMEMMFSGSLTPQQTALIADYRAAHHDTILGMPIAYGLGTGEWAGFLSYGHGYGLIQIDRIREALLLLYTSMAHHYTRGSWLAPETRRPLLADAEAAPYCTPAQLVAPLLARWLLVFEDPESDTLWLGKGMPRQWLQDGKTTRISNVPTRFGRVGFAIESHAGAGTIQARISLPVGGLKAETRLRLRVDGGARMKAVTLNGQAWTRFDADGEFVVVPPGTAGAIEIVVRYR